MQDRTISDVLDARCGERGTDKQIGRDERKARETMGNPEVASLALARKARANTALAVLSDHAVIACEHAADSIARAGTALETLSRVAALRRADAVRTIATDAFMMSSARFAHAKRAQELDERALGALRRSSSRLT